MALNFTDFKSSKYSQSYHYLVVGHPIEHSLSPVMHQIALDHHEINAGYHAVNLQPGEISSFISWMNRDEFLGCNITIPYKTELMQVADERSESAIKAGAINTISKSSGRLIGDNTDIFGFSYPLQDVADELAGERAIVFGTGGASKAVKIALEELGLEEIIFVSRNPADKQNSSTEGVTFTRYVDYSQWPDFAEESILFVNTTPLGMGKHEGKSVVDDQFTGYFEGKVCYDLVYNPIKTRFLEQAEEVGADTISGLEMFIRQGEKSFNIWTGKHFPVNKIRTELTKVLSGR